MPSPGPQHRLGYLLIWGAAALSGSAALGYEICWSRALVVPLGNSADATALVLGGLMLGIAGGAWVGGGLAERPWSPLRVYALCESLLGLYALAAPRLFWLLSRLPGVGVRYATCGLFITIPCLAMGASLPLLVRALTGPGVSVGHRISIAYGANTAGAAAGAFVVGFWGVSSFGVSGCSTLAALASLSAAGLAYGADRGPQSSPSRVEPPPPRERTVGAIALGAAFVGGCSMLVCEVVWSRLLTFVFGHDTYAFASLLAVVLLGLGLGGFAHRLVARRDQNQLVGALLGLFGVALLASFWGAAWLVIAHGRDPFGLGSQGSVAASVWLELWRELAYTPLLVLVPAVIAGALFPAACSLYAGKAADAGRQVGRVTFVNGVGSTLGALMAAFGLVSLTGIQGALLAVAVTSAIGASLVLLVGSRRPSGFVPLLAVLGILAFVPGKLPEKMLLEVVGPRHQELAHYEEARTATVAVIENQINGERQLLINSVNEVTTRLVHDQSFKVLGHLGPLLHPQAKTGVMICLGAGISAGAALAHPLERLDVVDLSSAVPRAARHFARENNGVLDDPRFHLYTDDGRQFLLNSSRRYDVAIVDSTHPKSVDSWLLYTREFYQLVEARLGEGGIVVQWLPLHGLSEREFKLIVRTFLGVFAEMTLWANAGFETYGQVAYAKLVGVKGGPLVIDYRLLADRLRDPRVSRDLLPYGMASVEELLDLYVAGPAALRTWTEGLPTQTDDHPIVPYTTAYSRGRRMLPSLLLGVRSPVAPSVHHLTPAAEAALAAAYEAQGLVLAGNLGRAAELRPQGSKLRLFVAESHNALPYYTSLSDRYDQDPERLFEAAAQLAALGFPEPAERSYERALELRPRDFKLRLNHGLLLLARGQHDRATRVFAALRAERPGSAIVTENLGASLLAAGDPEAARAHFRESLAWDPASGNTRLLLAEADLRLGAFGPAEAELVRVLRDNPWVAEAHDLFGLVAARRGDLEAAVRHHRDAIRLDAYRALFHAHLGRALGSERAPSAAAGAFETALRLDPGSPALLTELAQARAAEGRWDEAEPCYLDALDLDPSFAEAALLLGRGWRDRGRIGEAVQAFCLALQLPLARRDLGELGFGREDCGE